MWIWILQNSKMISLSASYPIISYHIISASKEWIWILQIPGYDNTKQQGIARMTLVHPYPSLSQSAICRPTVSNPCTVDLILFFKVPKRCIFWAVKIFVRFLFTFIHHHLSVTLGDPYRSLRQSAICRPPSRNPRSPKSSHAALDKVHNHMMGKRYISFRLKFLVLNLGTLDNRLCPHTIWHLRSYLTPRIALSVRLLPKSEGP